MINLKGRSFLTLLDFSAQEIQYLLDLSRDLKRAKYAGVEVPRLKGKNVCLLFQKDSTRTRCSFEVGAMDQGMHTVYLGPSGSQFGKKESVADSARVLGRMFDGIQFRGFSQKACEDLAKYSGVPVWNGLTDQYHPTQILADFLTIAEVKQRHLKGIRFAYLMFTEDPMKGSKNVDVIYTDVWVSMGEPDKVWEERIKLLSPYQVQMKHLKNAQDDVMFLHCLPAFHNLETEVGKKIYQKFGLRELEVTDQVFNSKYSFVFQEAENRLHTIKALMLATLGV